MYYWKCEEKLSSFILEGMKKYEINSVMVTMIDIWRFKLITKEAMEKFCKGEKHEKKSVNDDLESLVDDLRLGNEPNEKVHSYFLPKLAEEERKLVQSKDSSYFETLSWSRFGDPDVPEAEMQLSESKSKFVEGHGLRSTFTIKFPYNPRTRRHSSTE